MSVVYIVLPLALMVVAAAACNRQNAGPAEALPVIEASAAAAQPAAAGRERPVEQPAGEKPQMIMASDAKS